MADIVSWKEKTERLKASIARHREEAQKSAETLLGSFEVVAGGAVAAVFDAKLPKIPGTEIETKTAVGLGLTLIGLSEPFLHFGDVSTHLCNVGNGINAVNVYEETKRMLAS